jgi:hypothetical protein
LIDELEVSSEVGSRSEGSIEGQRESLGLGVSREIVRNTSYVVGSHGGASAYGSESRLVISWVDGSAKDAG